MMNIAFIEVTNDFDLNFELPMAYQTIKSYLLKYSKFKELIDFNFFNDYNQIPDHVDIIGVSTLSQNFFSAISFGKILRKKYPNCLIVLGGNHISFLPETLPNEYDLGVMFEGEKTFCNIIDTYYENKKSKIALYGLNGIVYNNGRKNIVNPPNDLINPLDEIPFPVIENLKMPPYLFSSRGCPYKCSFCSSAQFWSKTRFFSSDYVVNLIQYILDFYPNISSIAIWDDLVIANKERFKEIVEKIERLKLNEKLKFSFSVRANHVNNELLDMMKRMNVESVSFGAESASDRVLNILKGNSVTVQMNQVAINLLNKQGIKVVTGFVLGTPTETIEDVNKTLNFIYKNLIEEKVTFSSINLLMPLPGTEMWNFAIRENIITYPIDWNRLKVFASYRTSKFSTPEEWIQARMQFNSYYMNEDYIPQNILLDMIAEFENNISKIALQKIND